MGDVVLGFIPMFSGREGTRTPDPYCVIVVL